MNEMMTTLQRNDLTEQSCIDIGKKVLIGNAFYGGSHFESNYGFYYGYTVVKWPNHSVAVIRTEHMWDDIIHLDKLLGGSGEFKMAGHKYTHGSEKYSVAYDSTLSESNTIYLCCLIYNEIQVYQDLILKSLNLDHSQKRESLTSFLHAVMLKNVKRY